MIDVESLVAPVSAESPCGENLEYDPAFLAFTDLARYQPERQVGDEVKPGEPPEWRSIEPQAIALLARTKDLRLASALACACTVRDGLPGVTAGLSLVRKLCEQYWDSIFPLLDSDDDNDPTMRMNALACLGADAEFGKVELALLPLLRDARLAAGRDQQGMPIQVSMRQAEIGLGIIEPVNAEAGGPTLQQIESTVRADFEGSGVEWAVMRNEPRAAIDEARALAEFLNEKVGVTRAADMRLLIDRLTPIAELVARAIESLRPIEASVGGEGGVAGALSLSGEVQTRDQAVQLLDKVCRYLERAEPANPAPLLIRRAQRLMTMSFLEIMQDMAPEAVGTVHHIAGVPAETSE